MVLIVAFAVVYPIVNSGEHFSGGSDRDDDISIATRRLLDLDYPYYARTYLDNPISHLPGSYILAVPFVLLGNGAIQNFFWIAALFVFLGRYLRDWRLALFCLWMVVFLSPGVLRELMTGGDLISNNVYVLLAAMALLLTARAGRPSWQRCLAADRARPGRRVAGQLRVRRPLPARRARARRRLAGRDPGHGRGGGDLPRPDAPLLPVRPGRLLAAGRRGEAQPVRHRRRPRAGADPGRRRRPDPRAGLVDPVRGRIARAAQHGDRAGVLRRDLDGAGVDRAREGQPRPVPGRVRAQRALLRRRGGVARA